MILSNAFSINMLSSSASYKFSQVSLDDARELVATTRWVSAVGHADTATLFSGLLGQHVRCNRTTVSDPTRMLIGQYSGPRLPEACSTLPDGATITWWLVSQIDWEQVQDFYEGRAGSF